MTGKKISQDVQDYIPSSLSAAYDLKAQEKLEVAHDSIVHPDKFAMIFCKAAESQTSVGDIIKDLIKKVLSYDDSARKELKKIIKEVEKEEMWIWGKKIGFAVWTILMLVVGSILTAWITNLFNK